MSEAVVVALITGGMSLAGIALSARAQSRTLMHKLETALAVMETKMDELARETRAHNDFAVRIPVIEEQVRSISSRADVLERRTA